MSLTSEEVNYLIYRYLQESGMTHSAFTFGYESLISRSNVSGSDVPPGALITFLQKGLAYAELEAHTTPDGEEVACNEPFTLLGSHECRVSKENKKKKKDKARSRDKAKAKAKAKEKGKDSRRSSRNSGLEDMDVSVTASSATVEFAPEAVTTLRGHEADVFICSWSPSSNLLASGSGDATARIWTVGSESGPDVNPDSAVLRHVSNSDEGKDVTTLDWNRNGTRLATGSIDGLARIWRPNGTLVRTLQAHSQPIFTLKWNKSGDSILTGSVDRSACIWDPYTGELKQRFQYHKAPTLDVDWRDDTSFASCSTDQLIFVCKLGETKPLMCFAGHSDEVNAIKWNAPGTVLASCSDDHTAKLWSLDADTYLHSLDDHEKEIYTIKWSPTGQATANPSAPISLASASFDTTIKLWDVESGVCRTNLAEHDDPVYSIAYSPNGQYLASGSSDRHLYVWDVHSGTLVKTMRGNGGIFEVCWNAAGDKVAACFADHTVSVVEFRM